LAIAFSIGSIANACARISWGYLTDKTSFQVISAIHVDTYPDTLLQTTLSTATCFATALLLSMPMTSSLGRYAYLLWLILMFICLAATHALFMTAAVRCFGTKHKSTNYGCLILSTVRSPTLNPVFNLALDRQRHSPLSWMSIPSPVRRIPLALHHHRSVPLHR